MRHGNFINEERLLYLLRGHVKKNLNQDEKTELMLWVSQNTLNQNLLAEISDEDSLNYALKQQQEYNVDAALERVKQQRQSTRRLYLPKLKWIKGLAAACVLLMFVFIGKLLVNNHSEDGNVNISSVQVNHTKTSADVLPGGNKAILTLDDGTKIVLNDVSNGKIASQSGINITKTADGHLVYAIIDQTKADGINKNIIPQINTITTPKGGQYQINLPDGSKVWLNAASSLKFPTVFLNNERKVEITGEAYFEINSSLKNNVKLPFKVISYAENGRSQEVEVLGTHFNISAYSNENTTKTTLLEGKVRITNLHSKEVNILQPGQQAIIKTNSVKIARVDMEEVMAWKNGNFMFNNLPLVDILKQLERWYDVEVDYTHIPQTYYYGTISKNVTLSEVLDMLELTGSLKFRIENLPDGKRKVIVAK